MQARLVTLTALLLVANQVMARTSRLTIDLNQSKVSEPYRPPKLIQTEGRPGEKDIFTEVVTIPIEEPTVTGESPQEPSSSPTVVQQEFKIPVPNATSTVDRLSRLENGEGVLSIQNVLAKELQGRRKAIAESEVEDTDWD